MAELLFRVLARAGQTVNNPFSMNGGYTLPRPGDSRHDFSKIAADMGKVGSDLRKTARMELLRRGK